MNDIGPWRRIFPPDRRRPGPLSTMVRWRVELLLAAGVSAIWYYAGSEVIVLIVAVCSALVAIVDRARRVAIAVVQSIVVPHRMRSALIEAGVTSQAGRIPWIMWAWPQGENVVASVWLRSGTTPSDVRSATAVISAACGAEGAEIEQRSPRQDWVKIIVCRPRWGLPG
jgi:hypothetical protein